MIIDQDALDNLNFSLITEDTSVVDESNNDISKLINKYNIVPSTNHLIDSKENHFLFLVNHITDLYYLNEPIADDIINALKYDIEFKKFLLSDLERRLNNIITSNSALFFKEIGNIVNLLSLGNKYVIFQTYTQYNLDEVSRLFRDYEAFLGEINDNKELFELTFKCYITLIESFTQLCIINSTDIIRKKTINPLIERLTETNNMLKFTVTLNEEKIDTLNNILGKLLYYFSHVAFYEVRDKTVDYLIDEFTLILEKQSDGYNLSKDTNFGNNLNLKPREFIRFKDNSAYLILILIQKLEINFQEDNFFNSKSFEKLLSIYNKEFSIASHEKTYNNIEEFKRILLDSLIFDYIPYKVESSQIRAHTDVIDNFIQADEDFNYINLETIHDILLFSNQIEETQYLQVAYILTSADSIKNDYYEFFSIKTLDIIINKFINKKENKNIDEHLEKIFNYVEKHKTASQLLSMFTKIYLSLAHYYSSEHPYQNITKAKSFYANFVNINGYDTLENEYKQINHKILTNFGNNHINEINISKENHTENDLVIIGQNQISSYLEQKEVELKYEINQEISNLTSQILNDNNFDYEDINYKISHFISNRLFYGIASVAIKGLTKLKSVIEDTGYKQYSIPIIEEYEILFIFPAVYEDTFKYILQNNKEYIKQNTKNILTAYIKNNILYIDEITQLQNIKKLEHDISFIKEEITFVEISIPSLHYVNRKYGYDTGNRFFRAIGQKISTFSQYNDTIYRLSGARIGILLKQKNTYNELIKKIFNFNITLKGEEIQTNYVVAVTAGTKENILTKSYHNVEEAIINKKAINIKI